MKNINDLIHERFESRKEYQDNTRLMKSRVNYGIPVLYENAEIESEVFWDEIMTNLKKQRGYYFWGPVGSGKTYTMYAILRRARMYTREVRYWNFSNILAEFKASYHDKYEGEAYIIKRIQSTDPLMIDDIGTEKQTDWSTDIFYRIINFRCENKLITFLSSNLSLQELGNMYGDRIASRIIEMCEVKKINGEDRRLKGR